VPASRHTCAHMYMRQACTHSHGLQHTMHDNCFLHMCREVRYVSSTTARGERKKSCPIPKTQGVQSSRVQTNSQLASCLGQVLPHQLLLPISKQQPTHIGLVWPGTGDSKPTGPGQNTKPLPRDMEPLRQTLFSKITKQGQITTTCPASPSRAITPHHPPTCFSLTSEGCGDQRKSLWGSYRV
jgi:hypothetical protein